MNATDMIPILVRDNYGYHLAQRAAELASLNTGLVRLGVLLLFLPAVQCRGRTQMLSGHSPTDLMVLVFSLLRPL
jgi:hypothetical protein